MADLRYNRLQYELKVSRAECRGTMYYDAWHWSGSFGRWVRSKPKYKKHSRITIRRWHTYN